ncbi:MAG: apolipoprotein N-acyltransferase [Acidobacteriia bacterium]|nr:apolipoprotein N-acyltransferase [Terriglobia bacterium]
MNPHSSTWRETIKTLLSSPTARRAQLAVLSGFMLALIFPKVNYGWLAWFALLPLFFVLLQPITRRASFLYSLLFGGVFYALLLYWVVGVMHRFGLLPLPLAILFLLGFSLYNGLFLALFGILARKILTQNYLFLKWFLPTPPQIALLNSVFVAALWVAVEFLQTHLFGGFPWCLLGYSLVNYLGLMQMTTVTGIYGVSFLVCGINVLLSHALYQRKRPLFVGIAIVLGLLLTGDFAVRTWWLGASTETVSSRLQAGPSVHDVDILQVNIPQDTDWTRPVFDSWLLTLEKMILASHAEIAVMPENPAPFYYPDDRAFTERLEAMADRSGSFLVAGVVMSHDDAQGQAGTFNSAATLAPDGHLVAAYDKQHLVPFGEYVPLRKYLSFAGKLTREVSDFTAGDKFTLSLLNGNRAGISICYEAIFPDLVRRFTAAGAEVLINVTNDGWYGDSSAPYQHFEMSRVRAIENRRYLIRAANTGISAIVDPYGRIIKKTKLNTQVVLHGEFEYRSDQTFYVRFGDVFAWLCVVSSGGFLIFVFFKRREG